MVVDSSMDAYGVSMGFYIYNILWDIFVNLGLVYFPMIGLVVKETTSCLESQMTDMNTKGALKTIGVGLISMLLLLETALYPVVPLVFDDIQYYSRKCTSSDAQGGTISSSILGEESEFVAESMQVQLGGRSIGVPLLFYAAFKLGGGIKNWAAQELPCSTDIRLISEGVLNQAIENPSLRDETRDFVQICYNRARNKFLGETGQDLEDVENWPGNRQFVQGLGFYDNADGDGFYSRSALEGFGNSRNKLPESEGLPSDYGFPTCKEWWLGVGISNKPYLATEALSTRLYENLDSWLKENHEKIYETVTERLNRVRTSEYQYLAVKDAVVRESFFSAVKLTELTSKSTTDYGLQGDSSFTDYIFRGLGTVGVAAKSVDYFSGGSIIQLSMPMVKPFILMAIVLCIVPALVFSGYKWKYVWMFSFMIGSVLFWPFFWELARLVDDTFLTAMGVSLTEVNTQVISQWISSALYLYLPILWSMAMGWVGLASADSALNKLASPAASAGQNGVSGVNKGINFAKPKKKPKGK
ncbi:conjugal transfer protein TraG N-terminal domain-containing protein [Vibrio rotiferianus]|uniref:conjugal transfer protein TraG N-terminal domain-containing protein n=1 Tax=Vibrio rotiferianus TaxID=190895 RepID=UPI0005EF018C|nr:conjugal transfer protein TraG N-terminal domain-containing protein [Vibrio rotiferianus]